VGNFKMSLQAQAILSCGCLASKDAHGLVWFGGHVPVTLGVS